MAKPALKAPRGWTALPGLSGRTGPSGPGGATTGKPAPGGLLVLLWGSLSVAGTRPCFGASRAGGSGRAAGCWVAAAATRELPDLQQPELQAGHKAGAAWAVYWCPRS